MRKFEVSDRFTTADIGLNIEGDSLDELFVAGAEGMFTVIMGGRMAQKASVTLDVNLQSGNLEQLLVDWLSELLYRFDTDGLIPVGYRLKVIEGETCDVRGAVDFRDYDRQTDTGEHEIKAVTYYKLKIERKGGVYRSHVVFDI